VQTKGVGGYKIEDTGVPKYEIYPILPTVQNKELLLSRGFNILDTAVGIVIECYARITGGGGIPTAIDGQCKPLSKPGW
jgi:hypothetical protein